MNDNAIMKERDADFVRRARRVLEAERKRGVEPSARRLAVLTVYSGADSFHISYVRALNEIYRMLREGRSVSTEWAQPRQLRIAHLASRVVSAMAADGSLSVPQALMQVFREGNAPRFYIGIPYAITLLRRNGLASPRKRSAGVTENAAEVV